MSSEERVKFLCGLCTYNTKVEKDFINHYADRHKREMAYWCRECGRTFTSPAQLIVHIKANCTKVKSVLMRCGVSSCTFSGMDPFQFMQHIKIVHKGTHLLPCSKCRKLFTIPSCLIQHIQTECAKTPLVENIQPKKSDLLSSSNTNVTFTEAKRKKDKHVSVEKNRPHDRAKSPQLIENNHKHKKRNATEIEIDEGSDPDDPPWRPEQISALNKSHSIQRTGPDANLQSDIEILTVSNDDQQVEIEKEGQLNHKVLTVPATKTKFVEKQLNFQGDKSDKKYTASHNASYNVSEKEAAKKSNEHQRKQDDGSNQVITHHRYERWNDWWKAVSNRKSAAAMEYFLREENLRHFFTCMSFCCRFSTDDEMAFIKHQTREHSIERVPCRYCLKELEAGFIMAEHSVSVHGTRCHQCSRCLYRASTRSQVALHYEAMHGGKPVILSCLSIGPEPEVTENSETEVAMPYICRVGMCKYETCNPEEFVAHNKQSHVGVSVYPCFYCGAETFKLDALMRHYHLHGIYNFQCAYCVHGTNTIEEILFHQCLNHAERRMQVYVRPSSSAKNKMQVIREEVETPCYPKFVPDYSKRFRCGVEGCESLLCGLDSYKTHLMAIHSCSSYLPCPHCTAILKTTVNLEEHLESHGPHLHACGTAGCHFFNSKRNAVEEHCLNKHHDATIISVIREFAEDEFITDIKNETVDSAAIGPSSRENCVPFPLQLLSRISVAATSNTASDKSPISENTQATNHKSNDITTSEEKEIYSDMNGINVAAEVQYDDTNTDVNDINYTDLEMEAEDDTKDASVSKEEEYSCLFCNYTTTVQCTIITHLHQELEYFPFHCNLCNTKETELFCIRQHVADQHPDAVGIPFVFVPDENIDSFVFTFLEELSVKKAEREKKGHDTDSVCPLCDITSVPREGLQRHLANHLSYKPHVCLICAEKHFDIDESRVHTMLCHEASEGPLQEMYLPISRVERWLKDMSARPSVSHSKKVSSKKLYICGHCNFGPAKLLMLKEHLVEKHPGERLRLKRYPLIVPPNVKKKDTISSLPREVTCEKCGHVNVLKNNLQFKNPNNTPEKAHEQYREEVGFSFYRKELEPVDLTNTWMLTDDESASSLGKIKFPVLDFMKMMNFNARLRVKDFSKNIVQEN